MTRPSAPERVVLRGGFGVRSVEWRSAAEIGSAAFWIDQATRSQYPGTIRLGESLVEEIAACLLGGHGITGEMTLAAFDAVKRSGLLHADACTAAALEAVLRQPMFLQSRSRSALYRFPVQRSQRVAEAKQIVESDPPPADLDARELRRWLTRLPGVGPKTASWIARNVLQSSDVAIIDIHVHRAGVVAGVFDTQWRLPDHYEHFEDAFCSWASHGDVPAWQLDLCIWHQLASASRLGVRLDNRG